MYRRPLALLWTGCGIFTTAVIAGAFTNISDSAEDALIAGGIVTSLGALGIHGVRAIINTANQNRHIAEDVQEDVDQLRCQMLTLKQEVTQVKSLTHAIATRKNSEDNAKQAHDISDDGERPLAAVHQFRLHKGHREAIVGQRSGTTIDNADEIWAVLDANDTNTLPGQRGAS